MATKRKQSGAECRKIKRDRLLKESASSCSPITQFFASNATGRPPASVVSGPSCPAPPDGSIYLSTVVNKTEHPCSTETVQSSTSTDFVQKSTEADVHSTFTSSAGVSSDNNPVLTPDTHNLISEAPAHTAENPTRTTGTPLNVDPPSRPMSYPLHDIGLYVGNGAKREELNDAIRLKLLDEPWVPPRNYPMPFSTRKNKGNEEKRYLRHDHLERCPYLGFSQAQPGLFCRPCALFGPASSEASRSNQKLKRLVTEPLPNYDHLFGRDGYLTSHGTNDYHKKAIVRAAQFREAIKTKTTVVKQLDSARNRQANENRKRLLPIVKTIIFCGRQNIPLRGHRDDGALKQDGDDSSVVSSASGNFRALLQFRVEAGDKDLENHLKTAAQNATYISKTTQNQLIDAASKEIIDKIVHRVADVKYFSVLADETTDVSRKEQMSVIIRYVAKNLSIREDFLGFKHVTDLSGRALAADILSYLQEHNIDCSYLVGQGYDGASAMSGMHKGVRTVIQEKLPCALYVHCASHCLNLTLVHASRVASVRNTQGVLSQAVNFVNGSAKRAHQFSEFVSELDKKAPGQKLKSFCETRWVERHDSVITFCKLYPALIDFLTKCSDMDSETATKAQMLLAACSTTDFIVSVRTMQEMLAITKPLSTSLQKVGIDLYNATGYIKNIISVFRCKREDAANCFRKTWAAAAEMASHAEVELRMPRVTAQQKHRNNPPANDPEEYYLRSVYIPFLDHIIAELDERFQNHNAVALRFSCLIPKFISSYEFVDVAPVFEIYNCFLDSCEAVEGEFTIWKSQWSSKQGQETPATAIESLSVCDPDLFPNIHVLLRIMATFQSPPPAQKGPFLVLNASKPTCDLQWLRTD